MCSCPAYAIWDTVVDDHTNIKDGDTAGWRGSDFTGKRAAKFTCNTWGKTSPVNLEWLEFDRKQPNE